MLGPECRGKLLGLAGEDVATELRPAVQPTGEPLHRLQVDKTVAKFDRLRLGLRLHGGIHGQQQTRPQLHQPGGHDHPVAFLAQRHRRRRVMQRRGKLVDQGYERETRQVDLMRPRQHQQPVQWPVVAVEVEDWRPLPGSPIPVIGDDPVHGRRVSPVAVAAVASAATASARPAWRSRPPGSPRHCHCRR
jgi:hypothetical protein